MRRCNASRGVATVYHRGRFYRVFGYHKKQQNISFRRSTFRNGPMQNIAEMFTINQKVGFGFCLFVVVFFFSETLEKPKVENDLSVTE